MALPNIGAPAPDFTLPSTNGTAITLSALLGKQAVLLAFYPLAFTSTCTAELCEFSEDYAAYRDRGAVVLPISVDAVASLKAFKAEHNMQVDLLSDFHRYVSRRYGILNEARSTARRAYVLIDRGGEIRWQWVETVSGAKRSTAELIAQLDALQ